MSNAFTRPAFIPALAYKDPRAALDWLERAFGFEISGVFARRRARPARPL